MSDKSPDLLGAAALAPPVAKPEDWQDSGKPEAYRQQGRVQSRIALTLAVALSHDAANG